MSFAPPTLGPPTLDRPLMRFAAHVWFRRRDVSRVHLEPPRPAIRLMLAQIAAALAKIGARPVLLTCECWLPGLGAAARDDQCLARITIAAELADVPPVRSLASWFEWQHPRWQLGMPSVAIAVEGGAGSATARLIEGAAS